MSVKLDDSIYYYYNRKLEVQKYGETDLRNKCLIGRIHGG